MKLSTFFLRGVLSLVCLLPLSCFAQITITPGATAATLAARLTGSGVTVMNPVLTCPGTAEGTFVGPSTLSFSDGIVLTAGLATDAGGNASIFASTGSGGPGDADLDALAGVPTFDACVLEFDFRPIGDTIKFRYVFGSEEYPGFTCTAFNDVFGFLISGPGYATPQNIALVPGTTIPVCINSVNCGATGGGVLSTCTALGPGSPFCAYFVDNSAGSTITYDGLTSTLTAIAHVTPCDTYHLKIGIADATDDILDSGVFIEAGSLSSGSLSVAPISSNPADTSFAGEFCVRGCDPGKFYFNTGTSSSSQTIHYVIGGTAVNGYDYTHIADSIVIPPGDTLGIVYIYGLTGVAPGTKTVTVYIMSNIPCGATSVIIDSATITIYDSFYLKILTPDTTVCLGQGLTINSTGNPFLHLHWSPSTYLSNDTVWNPYTAPPVVGSTTYILTGVYPGLGCPPVHDHITVTVENLQVHTRDTTFCAGEHVRLNAWVSPLDPTYTYLWTSGTNLDNPGLLNSTYTQNTVGDFALNLFVISAAGCSGNDSIHLHVKPLASVTALPGNTTIGYGDNIQLDAINLSAYPLIYWWTPADGSLTNPNINNPIASPIDSTTYVVHAMNQWGCRDSASMMIRVIDTSVAGVPSAFTPNGDGLNDEFRIVNMKNKKLVEFSIFNRWGELVYFNGVNPTRGWNGTYNGVPQDMGVYNYHIILAKPDGTNLDLKGTVTLIR
ncbi:hypothetical protein CJD36_007140 [Flavipsychrobacter stenotrophus]|uniref:Ig-like domain-containing protein n=1 Tax=Flavipsychrobacter stenotrophus TaxID=2077091 RepID=A0A2S7SYA4_9BACT|nr:choice-of-anchor L domain-containing protein [Flavipsychrobacter stenotrophus]PQJ11565.1 hypothetical protein CJD36_007140 [Flavipsychrobacter stenotrophus]